MFIKRFNLEALLEWRDEENRKPLIIRGARQTGKSALIRYFGENYFDNLVEVNLEFEPHLCSIFEKSLDPKTIITTLSLEKGVQIEKQKTLLFIDEIQVCPNAILALRYFYEKYPDLHIIAAGSLLEFAFSEKSISVPVGRIQYLFLYPLSFEEFLGALGEEQLLSYLNSIDLNTEVSDVVHHKLLALVRQYGIIGGMPESVREYVKEPTKLVYQKTQQSILNTYRDDFGKYASKAKHKYLEKIFYNAPSLLYSNFKYSKVDREIPSRELKEALSLLEKAGVVTRIRSSSGHGLPLAAKASESKFKLGFLDVGLAQRHLGLDAEIAMSEDFIAINSGALAEQFVGQQLLSSSSPFEKANLYCWHRDKKSSSAEVDFLIALKGQIYPIEVKASTTGRLKSLRRFMDEHDVPLGIRISQHKLSFYEGILSVPFYLSSRIGSLVSMF